MTSCYISGVDSLVHHHAVARVGGRADAEMDRSTALRHREISRSADFSWPQVVWWYQTPLPGGSGARFQLSSLINIIIHASAEDHDGLMDSFFFQVTCDDRSVPSSDIALQLVQ